MAVKIRLKRSRKPKQPFLPYLVPMQITERREIHRRSWNINPLDISGSIESDTEKIIMIKNGARY